MENCNDIMDTKTTPLAANYEDEGMMDDMELEVTIKGAIMEESEVLSPSQVKSPPDEDIYYNRESGRKICGVCKRSAKRSHFGALCCDSCRAFFRRSVQNSVWETFICFKGNRCDISENRKVLPVLPVCPMPRHRHGHVPRHDRRRQESAHDPEARETKADSQRTQASRDHRQPRDDAAGHAASYDSTADLQ
ncbi:estrogen receptor-like [Macrobrachium nipponense]|uniref:estrogen receptor-like n=1 Tax=Macrobrachium nipponense TaxID=159736 RepID=UPI0030C83705